MLWLYCSNMLTNSFGRLDALVYFSDKRDAYSIFTGITGGYAT